MRWLLILLILVLVAIYFAYRYKKHLQTAWFMYQTFRRLKKNANASKQQMPASNPSTDTELTMCPKCGKWAAKEDSVKLKSEYYCSLACMEESMAQKTV